MEIFSDCWELEICFQVYVIASVAREWPEFVKELSETPEKVENLQVAGMVGSIDNEGENN